ncbi:zinc finger protein 189 [Anopheles sinensis]|uniref:Zinc finger protein 189 n=1 Tax=Anopheles sinensis TaxID=74873 RepID=A0A084VG86_ANOSI|nr:zinc finger protein 189 [Anopheles sinensis]
MQKEDPAFDVNKICRLCLQQLENGSFINIFTVNLPVSPLAMILRCAAIEVYEKDGFPPACCNACYYKLGMAFEFRNRCELSDQKLREFLNIPSAGDKREPLITVTDHTDQGKDDDIYAAMSEIFGPDESNLVDVRETGDLAVNELLYETDKATVKADQSKPSKAKQQIKRKSQLDELLVKHKEKLWLESTKVKIFRQKRTNRKQARKRWVLLKQPEQCLTCGKSFNYRGQLEAHQQAHSLDKSFECGICKRRFGNSNNYRLHMRIHSDEKRFQCEVCSKLFRTSSNLHAHLKTHSEKRNHLCTTCEKAFRTARELTNHTKTHSEVKNYVCRICSKAFVKQSYLTTHMNTVHVGLKRHRCQECGKQFSNSSNLIAHRRVHTGEKPYQCNECNSKFNQSSALSRHIRQQHRPKEPSPKPVQPSVSRASEPEELTIEVDENRSLESTASSELSVATSLMDNQPITYGGMPYAQTFVPQPPGPQPQHFYHPHHPHHHHHHHQPQHSQSMMHQSIAVNQPMAGPNIYSTEYLPPPYHSTALPATQQTHYDLGGYDMCYGMPASTVLNPSLMNPQPTYIFDQ